MEADKHPCKEIPGNTWYSFTAHGQTVGYSSPSKRLKLQLLDEVDDDTGTRTLRIVHADGKPVLDDKERVTGCTVVPG